MSLGSQSTLQVKEGLRWVSSRYLRFLWKTSTLEVRRLSPVFLTTFLYNSFYYLYLCGGGGTCVYRGMSIEDSFWESVLSFHYVSSRHQTQVFRLPGKHMYLQSHLDDSSSFFFLTVQKQNKHRCAICYLCGVPAPGIQFSAGSKATG